MSVACPFCNIAASRLASDDENWLFIWDAFPVTEGHLLIASKRHVSKLDLLTPTECQSIPDAIADAKRLIRVRCEVDGFNIGINEDAAGGQTVPHLHIHVIPRRNGDVADPRGGIRHVIPGKGNYIQDKKTPEDGMSSAPHPRSLIAGGEDALLNHLIPHIDKATAIDLTVAFILDSGVRLLNPHFQDLLGRGGRLRIVVGDYMGVTDPNALRRLLDLDGDVEHYVFEAGRLSFHPKSWIFRFPTGDGLAVVGSSNLSQTALTSGIEWNYRIYDRSVPDAWKVVARGFDALLERSEVHQLTHEWIDKYEKRRIQVQPTGTRDVDVEIEAPEASAEPHIIQRKALSALHETRTMGYSAGLVVLATGLGKTWLSAFDSINFRRVLFVAHREEILAQAMSTFRRIRPQSRFGKYTGEEKDVTADVLFASVQTLGRAAHLRNFPPDYFDYVIVDEFHHAAAKTYRTLIDHFTPRFLLGLTATPERTDGGDLLALCQENLVYRCDISEGIKEGLLSAFKYFGVPDEVDYAQIPWRSAAFDEKALTEALATQARAKNAFEQLQLHGGRKTIGFCCSKIHADFMARYFHERGKKAVAVHSGETSAPRATSLEKLHAGELDIIFAVDILNEGVDLPGIDTVLMLRPTESAIVWIQQFGRGLRVAEGKSHLNVIDYIGNHRVFLNKLRALFQIGEGDRALALTIEGLRKKEIEFPPGCEVTYDLKALDILQGLLRPSVHGDALEAFYVDFKHRHDVRPTATEAHHAGFNPRSSGHGSWFGLVAHMGDLTTSEREIVARHSEFLNALSVTQMARSYKMLVLEAMLAEEALPGEVSIERLVNQFIRIAMRNPKFRADVSVRLDDLSAVKKLLIDNPIAAWVEGRGTNDTAYFRFDGEIFSTTSALSVPLENQAAFRELVRELIDWRLARYLDRNPTPELGDVQNPEDRESPKIPELSLWTEYMREDIPQIYGATFNPGNWNAGIVIVNNDVVLLVTLAKGNLSSGNQYEDKFIDARTFQWQSQSRTKRASRHGRILSGELRGFRIHLFIRPTKLRDKAAAPFIYCGQPKFIDWRGDHPITVTWMLSEGVPNHLWRIFGINGEDLAPDGHSQ